MIDSIGTLRLELPGPPELAPGMRTAVAAALATAAGGPISARTTSSDGAVLLVRRLRLALAVPATDEPERLAASAGRELEASVRRCLTRPSLAGDFVRFDSVAEYIVHFIEQYVRGRPVHAWYFRPLASCLAPTLASTLIRLAAAEPNAWPDFVRLLRARGLMSILLRSADPRVHALLRGEDPDPIVELDRTLGVHEARPLFYAAWAIAFAAVRGRSESASSGSLPLEMRLGRDRCRVPRDEALDLYLSTQPAPPRTWADPDVLGRYVASMVSWILEHAAALEVLHDEPALAQVAQLPWLAPTPIRAVLSAATGWRRKPGDSVTSMTSAGEAPPRVAAARDHPPDDAQTAAPEHRKPQRARDRSHPSSTRPVSLNRTRALRYLNVARTWRSRSRGESSGRTAAAAADLEPEWFDLDEATSAIARSAQRVSAVEIEAWLRGAGDLTGVTASATPAWARLRAAAERLTSGEIREIAEVMHDATVMLPRAAMPTDAVGLFLLTRPLIDLRVKPLSDEVELGLPALRDLLRRLSLVAAGDPADHGLAHLFAHGEAPAATPPPAPAVETPVQPKRVLAALTTALRARAETLRLRLPAAVDIAGDPEPADLLARLLLDLACRQLVRWMRGFEESSTDFVLRRWVRRRGAISVPPDGPVLIEWPPSGYDVLLERAGYLDPLDSVPWWDDRGLRWSR
ncbi:MAG: hypothetical protein HY701_04015 [Gemmatimonadetes bacterium]|nr:hypothetical protein [Gemmatimonadota bacterium]